MPSPLRIEHVLTAESRAEYQKLVEQKPELPPDLEVLFEFMTSTRQEDQQRQDDLVRILVTQFREAGDAVGCLQVWLLWIFRKPIQSIASRHFRPQGVSSEVESDASWCFLEALNRVKTDTPFLIRNLVRDTNKLLRRDRGLESSVDDPVFNSLDELSSAGKEFEAQQIQSILSDLDLQKDEAELLFGRYIYDYSYDELAEQMGIAAATLRQRVHRLLLKVRKRNLRDF